LSALSFIKQNILLGRTPCDCAGGGFCSATRGVIGTPPFEIGWSRSREAPPDGRVLPYIALYIYRYGEGSPTRCRGNRGGKGLALKVLTGDTVQLLIASGGNCRPAPATFSLRCSTDDVPGMSRILGERCSSHARATAIGVASKRAATLDKVSDCSGEKPPSGKYGT